jgi:hypothetical protein
MSGARSAVATSAWSRATTASGVRAGAARPDQFTTPTPCGPKPGRPASLKVGTSGRAAVRLVPLIASGRSSPPRTWPRAEPSETVTKSTCLPSAAVTASPAPRKGTWKSLTPAAWRRRRWRKCGALPMPPVP